MDTSAKRELMEAVQELVQASKPTLLHFRAVLVPLAKVFGDRFGFVGIPATVMAVAVMAPDELYDGD